MTPGHQIANELQPHTVYRSGVLQHQARRALKAERPHMAAALLNSAIDASAPNQIGGRNHPSLFILRAESRLLTGRTRLALYDIQVLLDVFPTLRGLQETLNDLQIQQSLGRTGDTKELSMR